MKKIISLTLAALMGLATINAAENVLDGKFKVAANKYVKFTKSNLNYNGTTKRFEIISSQYETRGSFNENISTQVNTITTTHGWQAIIIATIHLFRNIPILQVITTTNNTIGARTMP